MCNFLSGIYTEKDGIKCAPFILSHADQIYHFGLGKDDKKMNLVKWEITPPKMKDFWNVKKWAFKIDQDFMPDWGDASFIESEVRVYLKQLLDDCPCVKKGKTLRILDGRYIAVRGCGTIEKGGEYTTVLYFPDKTTVEYGGNMTVEYGWNMTVKNGGNMTVEYGGNMTVEDGGYMTVKYGGHMTVNHGRYMTVEYGGYMTVNGQQSEPGDKYEKCKFIRPT